MFYAALDVSLRSVAICIIDQDGNHVYSQFKKKSDFKPPVRSPYNRSLLKDVLVSL